MHQEKVQQEKLRTVKARLIFEEVLQHSESGKPSRNKDLRKRLGHKHIRSVSESLKPRGDRSESPRKKGLERKTMFKRLEKVAWILRAVTKVPARDEQNLLLRKIITTENPHTGQKHCPKGGTVSEGIGSQDRKGRSKVLKKTICPNHGYVRKQILSHLGSGTLIFQRHECPSLLRELTPAEEVHQRSGRNSQHQAKRWGIHGRVCAEVQAQMQGCEGSSEMHENLQMKVGHTTDECMHLKRQIGETIKAGKLSHLIKELKQNNGKDQANAAKRGKPPKRQATGNPDGEEDETEGPMIIEAEMRGHFSIRGNNMAAGTNIPAHKNRRWEHSTSEWMNFMVVRSPSPYNGIIGRPEIVPLECTMVSGPGAQQPAIDQVTKEKIHVAIHPEYDLVIKICTEQEVIRDIEETFKTLREINMKLNLKKCTFGMREGIILGYKGNADELKVYPDKIEAVLSLPSPRCLKDVQKLNGKLASLNRFLSKSAEKSLSFFKTLKKCTKKSDFQWTAKAKTTFKQMKKVIAELPMLTAPKEKEELIVYLAAAKEAINAVLMTKMNRKQMPIYFVSRVLQGLEINYTPMEKLIRALVSASKRLKRYFQAHTIVVIMDQPIKQILSNPEVTGRLLSWSFKFEEHDIHYSPRTSVKGKILADFIVERPKDDSPDTPMEDKEEILDPWILFTDVSSCIDGSRAGLILTNPKGIEFTYALSFAHLSKQVLMEKLKEKSIDEKEVLTVVEEEGRTWMTPIHEYLVEEILLEEKKAKVVRRKARRKLIRECNDCQVHRLMPRNPQQNLTPITSPWPFYKWGIDIARPFLEGLGKVKFLIVAIDYFTKFDLPGEIISNNEKQFRDNPFKDWSEKLCIRQCFAYVKHPQANGLVERKNRSLGEGIKARLDERSKNLLEEISHVLWAHRTMVKSSNRETPFSLTYGTEAVIPIEIGMPTLRTAEVDMIKNNEALGINLDLLEEQREQAAIQEAKKQSQNGKIL
nr:reverse transcriptase domain-containing protein [Tanacetum cinerariifolium]